LIDAPAGACDRSDAGEERVDEADKLRRGLVRLNDRFRFTPTHSE
jgi:hypothetical protein